MREALQRHEELMRRNIPARVIDLFSFRPIDQGTLVEAAKAVGGSVIVVEDHSMRGGVGDAVPDALAPRKG